MLGPQHVAEELARVQRGASVPSNCVTTLPLRGKGRRGELRLPVRGADEWEAEELPRLDRGWQHKPPVAESAHRELRGCPVGAVFATAAQDELRWHYGGFVFDTAMRPLRGGSRMDLWVRAVFPDGFEDWWSELPDPAFAFLSQGEHVAPERVERARRQFGM